MKLAIVFCCLLGITTGVYGSQGFYFPDEIESSAHANSNAWSDGHGSSGANSNANAVSSGGSKYPDFYRPGLYESQRYGHGHGHHGGFSGGYPDHEYRPDYPNAPYDPHGYPHNPHNYYPSGGPSGFGSSNANAQAQSGSHGFGGQSNSNAQANSQNFGNGNSISNAIAGSQSLGSDGSANAAAAAASAGTSFVNGVPIASAAAAASAASTHGSSSSISSANAGGPGGHYPSGFNQGPYNNYYYPRNPWLRNGGTDDEKEADVFEAASIKIEVPNASSKDSILFEE